MTTKHKHADLIHAWADGAEIQCRYRGSQWLDDNEPDWSDEWEYRIKPEEKKPVVRWLWATHYGYGWDIADTFMSDDEMTQVGFVKLEWSRTEFPE